MGTFKEVSALDGNYKYWIWLQQSLGYGSHKINVIRRFYSSIVDFYNAGKHDWERCGCFTKRELEKLYENTLDETEEIIDRCELLGYNILTPDSEDYPIQLKEIYDPPAVLYVNGELPPMGNTLSIGVVGTREATPSGKKLAYSISFDLAKAGVNIISGGALGIDSSAHKGALDAGGKTVCVLGCGLNYNYLMSNAGLRADIAENGAVISEYPPNLAPYRNSFPKRNRIISALSQGILVVEAGKNSGALITAANAAEQNRDVFAVPGNPSSFLSAGTNELIKQGATPVTNAYDILGEYLGKYSLTIEEKPVSAAENAKSISSNQMNRQNIPKAAEKIRLNSDDKQLKMNSTVTRSSKDKKRRKSKEDKETGNRQETSFKKIPANLLSDEANLVYNAICENVSTIDSILHRTKLPINKILQSITELEIYGAIEATRDGKYIPV